MITEDTKLHLQAYIDGELSGSERQALLETLAREPELKSLEANLRSVKRLLAVGELAVKVPESREFYWSKIERAIERSDSVDHEKQAFQLPRWLRMLAPAAGVALAMVGALYMSRVSTTPGAMGMYLHEIETPLEDTTAISFHSQSAGMTVVWVQSPRATDSSVSGDDFE